MKKTLKKTCQIVGVSLLALVIASYIFIPIKSALKAIASFKDDVIHYSPPFNIPGSKLEIKLGYHLSLYAIIFVPAIGTHILLILVSPLP